MKLTPAFIASIFANTEILFKKFLLKKKRCTFVTKKRPDFTQTLQDKMLQPWLLSMNFIFSFAFIHPWIFPILSGKSAFSINQSDWMIAYVRSCGSCWTTASIAYIHCNNQRDRWGEWQNACNCIEKLQILMEEKLQIQCSEHIQVSYHDAPRNQFLENNLFVYCWQTSQQPPDTATALH